MLENLKIKGEWLARVYGPDGNLKDERKGENVVTEVGKEFLASFLYSAALAASTFTMKYIAVGTSSVGEQTSNTVLGSELIRNTGTVSYISGGSLGIFRVTATFTTGQAVGAISEYAVFSSSAAGTMLNRDTEATMNIGAADVLTVVCDLSIL